MPNYLQKIIDLLVAVVLMFLIPALYFSLKKDVVIQINTERLTTEFVETVTADGYITRGMYEKYLERLADTGKPYNVKLTHEQMAFEPEYRLRSAAEVIDDEEDLWTGTNDYYAPEVITEVPTITDPVNTDNMNMDTNESVLARAVNTPASPSHVHGAECYTGHRHTDGPGVTSSRNMHGCYTHAEITSSYCMGRLTYTGTYVGGATACPSCGKSDYTPYYNNFTCNRCGVYYSVSAGSKCSSCGYGNYITPSYDSLCYQGTSSTVYHCNLTEDTTIDCGSIVESIIATNPIQKVARGDAYITTAVITFKDGSSRTVVCTSDFSTNTLVQNSTVTLYYQYVIDGITYTKACNIIMTVVPKSKTCMNGHVYNLNQDGTDPGCPYCRGWLRSLTIFVPSGKSLTMFRNPSGSLETEGVGLLAVYLDGHTEYVYNGYTDNLDPDYVGTQTVTIGFKGLTTSLTVNVIRNRKKCDVCGLYYNLYMDDTDPGCPYCKAKVPVFTGHVKKYISATYEDEIAEALFEGNGVYYFRRGDVFTVGTESRKTASGLSIIGRLFRLKIMARSSDTIKNEEVHK